jgi:hypothetical protein
MRALVVATCLLAACTPDIVPGSYYCGPNAACPEDQVCSEATHTCGLAAAAEPFECTSALASEPDDTMETGFELRDLDCVTLPRVIDACMPADDSADWLTLMAPPQCSALKLDVRITFPLAFERLGVEIVDLATGSTLAMDTACVFQGESGNDLRCTEAMLTPGSRYAIRVAPTGEGTCGGRCSFNSYTVRVQLGPPG